MNRADCVRALTEEYARQRELDAQARKARVAEVIARDPEIGRLREENAQNALKTMKAILTAPDHQTRAEIVESMKARGMENNRRIRAALEALGCEADYLDMRYRCPVCRDTGLIGDAPSRFCDCFEARLRLMMFEDGSMAGLERQNFNTFDETVFPEAEGQRAHMHNARIACAQFADAFPQTKYQNVLLCGAGGTGKTFLLNCIFERVVSRGLPAVRVTAFHLFEIMRKQHLTNDENYREFDQLIETPLLLIDDLGTEPMMHNITKEYLFTLLNERMASGRHTVVATNLMPVALQERYDERIMSRLADRSRTLLLPFKGADLRLRK